MGDDNIIKQHEPNAISFKVTEEGRRLDEVMQAANQSLQSYFEGQRRALVDGEITRDIERVKNGFKVTITIVFAE
jgi:hypothetical protein